MTSFAKVYEQVRAAEGRLYPDEVTARLPVVAADHPQAVEWRLRAASARRLAAYLKARPRLRAVLEVGCGNGWLSNLLARETGARVWGVDVGGPELRQAARVFGPGGRVLFLQADVFAAPFERSAFEVIVLASAIQYFPDLRPLLETLRPLLKPGGELHLLDSPLYAARDVSQARARSRAYYARLGVPEMADYYHHHSAEALSEFDPVCLHDPGSALNRLQKRLGLPVPPFPWLRFVN